MSLFFYVSSGLRRRSGAASRQVPRAITSAGCSPVGIAKAAASVDVLSGDDAPNLLWHAAEATRWRLDEER